MSALYTLDILRLATGTTAHPRLDAPHATVERSTKTCGSRITVDVIVDGAGRVSAYGHEITACAVGQAAATVAARFAVGLTGDELAGAAAQLRAFLVDRLDAPPGIDGVEALVSVRAYPARHEAALLAFDAVASAAMSAPSAQAILPA